MHGNLTWRLLIHLFEKLSSVLSREDTRKKKIHFYSFCPKFFTSEERKMCPSSWRNVVSKTLTAQLLILNTVLFLFLSYWILSEYFLSYWILLLSSFCLKFVTSEEERNVATPAQQSAHCSTADTEYCCHSCAFLPPTPLLPSWPKQWVFVHNQNCKM